MTVEAPVIGAEEQAQVPMILNQVTLVQRFEYD